jgi:hypothetical protein
MGGRRGRPCLGLLARSCLLPIVESARARGKTAIPELRTHDDERFASAAAGDADRVFGPLDPIHPGPLEGGLHDFARNHHRGDLLAVHLELGAGHGCLRRTGLMMVQKFGLARASRREEYCGEPGLRMTLTYMRLLSGVLKLSSRSGPVDQPIGPEPMGYLRLPLLP